MTSLWRNVRFALLAFGFGLSLYAGIAEPAGTELVGVRSRSDLVAMLVTPLFFFPISMLIVLGLQIRNPFMARVWTIPTHGSNPFRLRDPLHFFHFGAYFSGAGGVGYLAAGRQHTVIGLMCISMFAGLLSGVRIFPLVFRSKFGTQG